MIAETSRENYRIILSDGTQESQKTTILCLIEEKAKTVGLTLREIAKYTGYEINAVSGRVNDLKKDGLVVITNKRKCSITGKIVAPVIKNPHIYDAVEDHNTGEQIPIGI